MRKSVKCSTYHWWCPSSFLSCNSILRAIFT